MTGPVIAEDVRAIVEAMQPRETLLDTLGIEMLELGRDRVVARMLVGPKVHQPFGLLHGGASVALAETVASFGGYLNVAAEGLGAVGLEINANHLRGLTAGWVTATGTPIHRGRSTQVWNIEIVDEAGRAVCISRCTLSNVPLR